MRIRSVRAASRVRRGHRLMEGWSTTASVEGTIIRWTSRRGISSAPPTSTARPGSTRSSITRAQTNSLQQWTTRPCLAAAVEVWDAIYRISKPALMLRSTRTLPDSSAKEDHKIRLRLIIRDFSLSQGCQAPCATSTLRELWASPWCRTGRSASKK